MSRYQLIDTITGEVVRQVGRRPTTRYTRHTKQLESDIKFSITLVAALVFILMLTT